MPLGVRVHEPPVGGHDVGADEVVAREAEPAGEEAHAAVERQPGDAGARDDAERRREAEGLSLVVDVAEPRSAAGADRPLVEVDDDVPHRPRGR